ncbi:hypothetical protein N752_29935 [Desulforamulus aquiferis]|nr:hypothetical protein N752_29935 [Desulforamulus aquiferis]
MVGIAEYKASGQSVVAWCAENDIKPQQLWYWLKKEKPSSGEKTISWLPLDISNDADSQTSLLVIVGPIAVEVRPGFDPKLLLDVVNTLKHND